MTSAPRIIACLKRDGFNLDQAAQYCRTIAQTARHGGADTQESADTYQLAADSLERQDKAEKLALDHVSDLEAENQHLASRVFELETTIVNLIWGANI
jgi:hypothetical protein